MIELIEKITGDYYIYGVIFTAIQILGLLLALHAIMQERTSQGAIAWASALVFAPILAIPFYILFGRNKFIGYIEARRKQLADHPNFRKLYEIIEQKTTFCPILEKNTVHSPLQRLLAKLSHLPWSDGNKIDILINGRETFSSIFQSIKSARSYILIEFFIIKNDTLGDEFQRLLIEKAREGVSVYILFDEIGSHKLDGSYIHAFRREKNIYISPFSGKRKWFQNIVQINFRNHRKIVVIDGLCALIGGLNVGNEYLGLGELGYWRDTFIKMRGSAALAVQVSFLEDWHWATDDFIEGLHWEAESHPENKEILVLPSGPADTYPTWKLSVIALADTAQRRLWIASPYFVPDQAVVSALQMAALRGVDVRILLPEKPDHLLVYLSSYTFYNEILPGGIRVFRYTKGFLHEKVLLIDDDISVISTANFDNRSMYLNFEIGAVIHNHETAAQVSAMFETDFSDAVEHTLADYENKSFYFRLGCRLARLAAPIQ